MSNNDDAVNSGKDSTTFRLVDARKAVFDKFPAELKCQHVYRHFYTDIDEEASQLSLQWFSLLISYFCSLCRLEGRRVQYTSNGQSERFGAEFARAHQRAAILFERVTTTYRKILLTYNVHSKIATRKRVGPRVIRETFKMNKYVQGAKCDVERLSYDWAPAFLYALDELRFHEELVNFTAEIMKRAFTDERLQKPIVAEVIRLFRSDAFSFKFRARESEVDKARKSLEEARGVDSILHNCHRLAQSLVAPPEPVPLKLALRQRSPFVACNMNHPLLTTLGYQRAFARRELDHPQHATFHVRLREGEESPHRKELRDIRESLRAAADSGSSHRHSKPVHIAQRQQRSRSSSSRSPRLGEIADDPAAPSSKAYWERVGASREEEAFTVETHQPMFAPSHRALSSLTPVAVIRARQQQQQILKEREAREAELTKVPADSKLPRLFDFDRAEVDEEDMPRRVGDTIDHATEILHGRGAPFGRSSSSMGGGNLSQGSGFLGRSSSSRMSLSQRFSTVAKRVAKASSVRTNEDVAKRNEKKAVDRLMTAAAATAPMSEKIRKQLVATDPAMYFVAPIDPQTGKEDFTLYDPTQDIDAVYQQLAHGVSLEHFSVPLDISVSYDATGLLIADV